MKDDIYSIRLSRLDDIPEMQKIFSSAREKMRADGNIQQWTGGYPSDELLKHDIYCQHSFVVEKDQKLVATFVMVIGKDPTYSIIYDGSWIDDSNVYATIHRIAALPECKGIAKLCFDFAWEKTRNLRIDTHSDNLRMRHIVESYGFTYCGIIHLKNGDERLAYQKCDLTESH